MNYGLSERKIKQMSDTYAFRRGKRYVAAKKVTLRNYQSGDLLVEAAVQGEDLFTVTVRVKEHGVDAGCNCPSLAMDQSFCGHIVAVLLAMHHVQVYGTPGGKQSLIRPFATTRQTEDAAVTAYLQTLRKTERAKIRFDVSGSAIVMESITAQQRFIISPMYFDRLLQRRDHLRNLADVWLSPPLKQRLVSGPPTVELALDREAGGLELLVTFSYQGVRINPLQETDWLGRDVIARRGRPPLRDGEWFPGAERSLPVRGRSGGISISERFARSPCRLRRTRRPSDGKYPPLLTERTVSSAD